MQNCDPKRGRFRSQLSLRARFREWRLARTLGSFAFFLCIGSLADPSLAQNPPTAKLVEIRVTGSQRYAQADLVRATELAIGSSVTSAVFQEAANRLSASGAFSKVDYSYSARDGGVAVEFRVADGSDFAKCVFDNLIWFPENELRAHIKEMIPLFGDEIPLKGDIPAKIEAILALMLEEKDIPGTVRIMGAGEAGVTAVKFSVEGVRLVVQQVEMQGAGAINPSILSAAMQPLLGTQFNPKVVHEYVSQNVGWLYAREGYLKASFSPPSASLMPGSVGDLMVVIQVTESSQYRLRAVRWEGNAAIPSSELAKFVHVQAGQPADMDQVDQDLTDIQRFYATKGYLTAQLSFEPELDDTAKQATLNIKVREGDLYSMGKLEITGIDPVRAEGLRKTSELLPGQPFNRDYWNTFIAKSGRLLPSSRTPWKATTKEDVHADTKTVDVTVTFAADTEP